MDARVASVPSPRPRIASRSASSAISLPRRLHRRKQRRIRILRRRLALLGHRLRVQHPQRLTLAHRRQSLSIAGIRIRVRRPRLKVSTACKRRPPRGHRHTALRAKPMPRHHQIDARLLRLAVRQKHGAEPLRDDPVYPRLIAAQAPAALSRRDNRVVVAQLRPIHKPLAQCLALTPGDRLRTPLRLGYHPLAARKAQVPAAPSRARPPCPRSGSAKSSADT